jgi:trehalose-phosphatase
MNITKLTENILLSAIGKNPAFFFDFDGTLSEIVPTPEQARLKPITRCVVKELSRKFPVGIISGRELNDLKRLVGLKGIFYSGNHGVEIDGPGLKFVEPHSARSSSYIEKLSRKIRTATQFYGSRINFKKYSVSVHYRTIDPNKVQPLLRSLNCVIAEPLSKGKIVKFHGKKVVELKPPVNWNKGSAIELITRKLHGIKMRNGTRNFVSVKIAGQKLVLPVFFGDDTTDEFGFETVNSFDGISVLVGKPHQETAAKYWVRSPDKLVELLVKFLLKLE